MDDAPAPPRPRDPVGYELYREARHHAPAGLGAPERLLLGILADEANDDTRRAWPPTEDLLAQTGLTASGLRQAFQRLAAHGLELRVAHGVNARGRAVYTAAGRQRDYYIPKLPAPDGCVCPRCKPRKAKTSLSYPQAPAREPGEAENSLGETGSSLTPPFLPPDEAETSLGETDSSLGEAEIRHPSPQSPQGPLTSPQSSVVSQRNLLREAGLALDGDDDDQLIRYIDAHTRGPHAPRWWNTLAANGDLHAWRDRWRRERPTPRETPWCGKCSNQFSRLTGPGDDLKPCPDCSPARRRT